MLTGSVCAQADVTWYGVLDAGGQRIPLNVAIAPEGDDGWTGSLQSPGQSPMRIPLSELRVTDDSLRLRVATAGITYVARVSTDSLTGDFQQGGFSAPMTLYRQPSASYRELTTIDPELRPQDPTDFPYRREQVTFPGGAAGVSLAGELTVPEDAPPRALLVLVTASGPQDRNQDMGPAVNHRPFLVLSDYLTRRGYGVLRYDDRGVGESTGRFAGATSADFAADATEAVRYLRSRGDFANVPVGMAGHSEGGLIGPIAAASGEIDFLVLLAAPGHPIDSLMRDQRSQLSGTYGAPMEVYHAAAAEYLGRHPSRSEAEVRDGLLDTLTTLAQRQAEAGDGPGDNSFIIDYARTYSEPWMRYFITYVPADYLRRTTVPVLAINGYRDRQVDVSNLEAISAALERAGNQDYTALPLAGLNHLLQPASTGQPDEYARIETTIDPGLLAALTDWLDARF